MQYLSRTEKSTIAFGKKLAGQLQGGEVIALQGNLGAGKTTLIKGIAAGLGIKKIITSPTFLLLKVYPVKNNPNGIKMLVHLDCYRISQSADIVAIGALDYFGRKDAVVVIEWAERIKELLPRQTKQINLKYKDETGREIIY